MKTLLDILVECGADESLVRRVAEKLFPKEIVHQLGPHGLHRLCVGDKHSEWTSPLEISRCGRIVATTDSFSGILPQVSVIFPVSEVRTESVQSINFSKREVL